MRILRAEHHRRMPWKNGGGETTEIAIFPENASVDDFGWRVSMATVTSDGAFSVFPGVERTLSVLEGEGIILAIDGRQPVILTPASDPLSFPADVATSARLVAGTITDLNVMTRRGSFKHRVARYVIDGEIAVTQDADMLFCAEGGFRIAADTAVSLDLHDAVILDRVAGTIRIEGSGVLFVIGVSKR